MDNEGDVFPSAESVYRNRSGCEIRYTSRKRNVLVVCALTRRAVEGGDHCLHR